MGDKMAVEPCRGVLTSLFSVILNSSLAFKQAEFFYSGFFFSSDNPEALS